MTSIVYIVISEEDTFAISEEVIGRNNLIKVLSSGSSDNLDSVLTEIVSRIGRNGLISSVIYAIETSDNISEISDLLRDSDYVDAVRRIGTVIK